MSSAREADAYSVNLRGTRQVSDTRTAQKISREARRLSEKEKRGLNKTPVGGERWGCGRRLMMAGTWSKSGRVKRTVNCEAGDTGISALEVKLTTAR